MKRALILILLGAATTTAVARDRKAKVNPGPYVFTSKATAQTVKDVISRASRADGYDLETDHALEFRFSRPAQMPLYGALFMASSACPGMTTKQTWSYILSESNGITKVTVQPAWEYPDDYCQTQTHEVPWSQPQEIAAFQEMLDRTANSTPQSAGAAQKTVGQLSAAAVAAGQEDNGHIKSAGPVAAQDDAARHARQHQACLDLAKDNPAITCN